jgi:hypothetical protein
LSSCRSDHLNNLKLSIRMWRAFLAALLLMPGAHAALGQAQTLTWPGKPVRISVPVTAGSAIDLVCRTVFDQVSQQVGQPFIIDNRRRRGRNASPRCGRQSRS